MFFILKVWRQAGPRSRGHFQLFDMDGISGDTSFLEMLDILNNRLVSQGKETIAFDHDCRKGSAVPAGCISTEGRTARTMV